MARTPGTVASTSVSSASSLSSLATLISRLAMNSTRFPARRVRDTLARSETYSVGGQPSMRRILATIVTVTTLLAAGAARAEVIQRYSTGSWTIEANARNGALQNCTATGQYGGGASVLFMLTNTFN